MLLAASVVHALARGDTWHPLGFAVVALALLIGGLNVYLSLLRRLNVQFAASDIGTA